MATIQDVARYAGVGAATVSRVLSGNGYVKQETRERVQQAIEELHYTPNEMARTLFFRKSSIVAVIVPELAHPFFSELVNAIEVSLSAAGYQTMVCNTFYEASYELRYIEMLKRQIVDGIIFASHISADLKQYKNIQRPIVAIDRNLENGICCVASDHEMGGRMAAEELIACGCRHVIQFRGGGESVRSPYDRRHEIFEEVMKEKGILCDSIEIRWCSYESESFGESVRLAFEKYPDADGVFGADLYAMACHKYALENKMSIPGDLKIVAYDGTNATRFLSPSLTTVCQPIHKLAEESVKKIVEQIAGEKHNGENLTLPVWLRKGESTAG